MAVVQISRIQVRRGKKNAGTGLPQLASGEVAWAVDTQELFIGNGAVSEGSPYVGNTKILTEHDSLLDLAGQYQYRKLDDDILTGIDSTHPVVRSLQQRLDERVSVFSFGVDNTGIDDVSTTLQQAVNQLFLNPANIANTSSRVILEIPAGVYKLTDVLYIPSNATIVGAGIDKTIFEYIGDGTAIEFVRSTTDPIEYNNQAQNIVLRNLTINSQTTNKAVLELYAVRDSLFENVVITGNWDGSVNDISPTAKGGIHFSALSSVVSCQRNIFKNVTVSGFTYGVYSKEHLMFNTFDNCYINTAYIGAAIGRNATSPTDVSGPRNNIFTNCRFENILRQAVYVFNGRNNSVTSSFLSNVGNNALDGNGSENATYTQIYFAVANNSVSNNFSDRARDLSTDLNPETAYVGEIGGVASYSSSTAQKITLGVLAGTSTTTTVTGVSSVGNLLTVLNTSGMQPEQTVVFSANIGLLEGGVTYYIQAVTSGVQFKVSATPGGSAIDPGTQSGPVTCNTFAPGGLAFRLPIDTDSTGYEINYIYRSTTRTQTRRGTLTLIVDTINRSVQLTDSYDYVGTNSRDSLLFFTARLSALNGASRDTLEIWYTNTSDGDVAADFIYSYSAIL
jgi:hypothetical protein